MEVNTTKCFKVSDDNLCPFCKSSNIVKNGRTKNKKQQYFCKECNKRCIDYYTYNAYNPTINQQIVLLTKEGLGIRSTARILQISTTTLLKRIIAIAQAIPRPVIDKNKIYEVDELCSYLKRKSKKIWIAYALERTTKAVVSFAIGARTSYTLKKVLTTLHHAKAKAIYTEGLKNYKYLVTPKLHKVTRFGTNHIERNNLTLRTHLKRFNRRTICYSKSLIVLSAILKIYFWNRFV